MLKLTGRRVGSHRRGRTAIVAAVVSCVAVVGVASAAVGGFDPFGNEQVGQTYAGSVLLPTNQWISPLGSRVVLVDGSQKLPSGSATTNARLVSSTLSPDGVYMAALSWNDFQGFLTIINVKTGNIVQQVGTGSKTDPTIGDGTVAADGPLYSSDGKTLWFPQSSDLVRFTVDPSTGTVSSPQTVDLPTNVPGGASLPSGMALDGTKLYVALNGANTLGVIDTTQTDPTKALIAQIPAGNAPRQVVLADNGTVAYVSNEGGRPSTSGDFTNLSDGTPIVSSRTTGGAITGTVSVVDLATGKEVKQIPAGLQPTALYQHGQALFVANSNDDSVSVIDERTNTVTQTVHTNPVPGATVGSYANAISMPDASHVLVSIGRDDAIAVYRYRGLSRPMRYLGLLPTD